MRLRSTFRPLPSITPVLLTLAAALLLVGTSAQAHTLLVAKRITSTAELCQGPEARGEVGHYLLMNAEIKAVVSAPDYAYAFSSSGGNLLDLARTADNYDGFTHFYTLLKSYWPNQANYTDVRVERDGSDDHTAVIRATGTDVSDPQIEVVTDYSLGPHDRFVTVVTTITNHHKQPVADYAIGDAVQWGVTDNFGPGVGYELLNVDRPFPWVAAQGDRISYAYTTDAAQFDSMNHSTWTDSYIRHLTLPPGGSYTFRRYLAVGTGSISSAVEVLFDLKHVPLGRIEGYLREHQTDEPIGGATVIASTSEFTPFLTTTSNAEGHFHLEVPAGAYSVAANAPGRLAATAREVTVRAEATASADFGFGARGSVSFEVRDADSGGLLPAKLSFFSREGPDPYFGSPDKAAGALNTVFTPTGTGELAVPPGDYRVVAMHGLAFSVDWANVTVTAGQTSPLHFSLRREVKTPGWFTADFHVHAVPSNDSTVSLRDRVTSLVAEGIQVVAATDHNVITDYSSTVHALGLEALLFPLAGDELTTVSWGHFNVYPLIAHPDRRWGGALPVLHKTPATIFAEARAQDGGRDKVVQVNHPRWPYQKHAYFDNVQLDVNHLAAAKARGLSLNFDALEIMNGLWNGEHYFAAKEVLHDWFGFLNRGYTFTAVGDSDSHTVVAQEVGYPRNYVFLGPKASVAAMNAPGGRRPAEQAVVDAVKHHHIVVSNGPFVSFTAGGGSAIGDLVTLPATQGPVRLQIHIAWPAWMGSMDTLSVYANGQEAKSVPLAGVTSPADLSVKLNPTADTWIVLAVRGSRPMDPVLPTLKGRANTPFAVTNPIWIDRDANGRFDAPVKSP